MYSVYLVDDDALILEELVDRVPWMDNMFEVAGSETDPRKALDEILSLSPDVVFCDLKMPGMDGNELIGKLRESGLDAEYVMLSAYDSYENVRAFFQQSGYDYILKPVNNEDIQMVLEGLTKRLQTKKPVLKDEAAETENPAFNEMIAWIDSHYAEKISLDILSERFHFSKSYICRMFQTYYNKSLTLYLTDLRMAQAKKLLKDKSILVKEVAYHVGYSDYFHFFKVFKNHYGISPKDMRENGS